jgi:predicted nucleotidyltransferase
MATRNPNIEILEMAVARLGDLREELVFLGGCATGLLITDSGAPPIRMTRDVDVIAEVSSLSDYHSLSARLRSKGFSEDLSDDAPICRWVADPLILDVMPTDARILGFGNRWYTPSLHNAVRVELPSGEGVNSVSAPYFLATKLEAFDGRGKGDYLLSHDIEDLVAVIDGRTELLRELAESAHDLKDYLAERFASLLVTSAFMDALPGHLSPDHAGQARVSLVTDRMQAIAAVND